MDLAQHIGLNKINIPIFVNYYQPHLRSLKKNFMTIFKLYGISMDSSLQRRRARRVERKVVKRRSDEPKILTLINTNNNVYMINRLDFYFI